jgi:hypothetical protein
VADNKIWLDVAFAEKDEAKAHGARWDRQQGAGTRLGPVSQPSIAGRHCRRAPKHSSIYAPLRACPRTRSVSILMQHLRSGEGILP